MRDFHGGEPFGSPEELYAAAGTQQWGSTGPYDPFLGAFNGTFEHPGLDLVPQRPPDRAEEPGFLLQETMAAGYDSPPVRQQPMPEPHGYAAYPEGRPPDPFGREDHLATLAPTGLPGRHQHLPPRRRRKARRWVIDWPSATSFSIATLTAALVFMVSLFGGIVAYEPLRRVAELRTPGHVADWWPLLVYGPWAVASLSILRAAIHQRRALHSWIVVLVFSGTAILLCLVQAPRTLTGEAMAVLPQMASLACLHQLVRLITLTKPLRKSGARRRTALLRTRPPAPPPVPHTTRPIPRDRRTF
ncbi:DUF2637 domain-containing protein [Streptomyces sp. NPDC097981]|uniref:DUF2637 domain-containing protein n=1 Tax=Streptomyces sp. NPDC097981 TaxID=3155428 RepID=UPI0033290169